ncbi:MAG TPA: PEP/pyruvate-binding domain-containing protein [Thermoanaerobaculia bacterium]|nr:PEP/pyruvate-binding domain-containing protein [Thermoanaerobaculia bacterium]
MSEAEKLTLPFGDLDRTMLPIAGGKAANLGELARAGLPVPDGFCLTTAAYELVAEGADLDQILNDLAGTDPEDTSRLAELAAAARASLSEASVPDDLVEAITRAYRELGNGASVAVAVRSSATAEDLPYASFAGQQDTYLNVVGADNVLDAVRRCWVSLWTDRAVSYRASNGIDHRSVRLAVVVQRMVEAEVAGILFTANPLTGRRRQAVIDAAPGLGEAVVSGAVNPDHFVVNTSTGEIVERRLGDKRVAVMAAGDNGTKRVEVAGNGDKASLGDDQIRALADLGARVEAHYGSPQDIEWAIDGEIWLLQARPITTLFPLPAGAPATDEDLRVYFSVNVAQGVYRPLTPMGLQAFRLVASSMAAFAGRPPRDPYAGPAFFTDAGGRIFLDITPALRNKLGSWLLDRLTQIGEARATPILRSLGADARLAPVATRRWPFFRAVLLLLVRGRIPLRVAQALAHPEAARARVARLEAELRALGDVPPGANASQRLRVVERMLRNTMPRVVPGIAPVFGAGMAARALAGKLLGNLATADELQVVLRGLPHNPTTQMDLALWALAREVRADPSAARTLRETPPVELARSYREGTLSPRLQAGLESFLRLYGHRGVAEIDLGLPRWSEDPTYIIGVLANYLRLDNPELAPDVQFGKGAREAEEMAADLTRRARRKDRLRGTLVGFLLKRARALAGLREVPKFYAVVVLTRARELLLEVGDELAEAGRLRKADDIFFVTLPEARAALAGKDLRSVVRERRAVYDREVKRRHVPRILLSDGTEPEAPGETAEGALHGSPASPGTVSAKARVIFDPSGAQLEPGEILVAPSTDPGWTPLFLTAGGLVMEMGGAMSHGAVVAREYGIPAVVGVPDATGRISTGERITVDGSAGTVASDS